MEKERIDKNIGKKLDGRYEILELIGEGGMADVYRATDVVDKKTVAVKILKKEFAENEEFLRRFRNESKAIGAVRHPNIVKILDLGFSDRIQFIVMEYIDGITLNEYMEQQGQLSWKDAVHFILQILRALQNAHSKGIVHRDIKPQNIMMLRDGTIKVMDFGIAKIAREDGKTGTDKAIGTVHYISPEQARGGATDARSDIYSVGVLLYEMITGKKPFDTDNPVSIAVMHMQAKLTPPSEYRADLQIGLEEIILKAMEKDPADRYQSAREMMDDLQNFKENPDGVFGYYPDLLAEDEAAMDDDGYLPEEDDDTRYYEPGTEQGADDGYYDDEDQDPYYDEDDQEPYYDEDESYDDEDDEEEEESHSLFVPILSAVIIVVIVVAAVLFTTLLWNMIKNNTAANKSQEWKMPNLIGMDYDEADRLYGDKIDIKIESKEYSEYETGKIFAQDIEENNPVGKGDVVYVRISLGAKKVTLPLVEGWDYDTAEQTITQLHLQVDKRTSYNDDVPDGKVIYTEPKGPCEVEPGSYVLVMVSKGKNKDTIIVPNFINMTWDLARATAEGLGLVLAKEEVDDSSPEGTVLSQNVAVGEEVTEDTPITLKVSTGKSKEQEVRVSFAIPAGANGIFHIALYEDGIAKAVGGSFYPEYANGVTSVAITGKGQVDLIALLTNETTGAEAKIGTYRIDFDGKTATPVNFDVEKAFQEVGGISATTTTATSTTTTGTATTSSSQATSATSATSVTSTTVTDATS